MRRMRRMRVMRVKGTFKYNNHLKFYVTTPCDEKWTFQFLRPLSFIHHHLHPSSSILHLVCMCMCVHVCVLGVRAMPHHIHT